MTKQQWIDAARRVLEKWQSFGKSKARHLADPGLLITTGDLMATRFLMPDQFDRSPPPAPEPPEPALPYIDLVFSGPPGPESPRFIEAEDAGGRSISIGTWIERPDGLWALRIPDPRLFWRPAGYDGNAR